MEGAAPGAAAAVMARARAVKMVENCILMVGGFGCFGGKLKVVCLFVEGWTVELELLMLMMNSRVGRGRGQAVI